MTLVDILANIGRRGDNLLGSRALLNYEVGDVPSVTENVSRFSRAYVNELIDDTLGKKEFLYLAVFAYLALC